jgi:nitrous oxidase accessory protein NosD
MFLLGRIVMPLGRGFDFRYATMRLRICHHVFTGLTMGISAVAGLVIAAAQVATAQAPVAPTAGMTLTTATRFRPGAYELVPAPGDSAAIVVRGNDITIDLTNVELAGAPRTAAPDSAARIAILVDGGSNVTIRGGRIRGYRIAILARGTRNLRILDNDLSFNWKPRLHSIVEHESLADWLSFHQNEKDEWMRFGAAIYLRDVRGGEVKGNTVHHGMNGLLMTRTDSMLVWNNDVSFNSGLGFGLYRSDHNRIMHNQVDFNVRGYSEGFYRRGQDSAGILIYEQSDSNTVAFNSVTHGGDGLFLWAGQHTMDTGKGGANDNLFFHNDFSWAPTNGMEATFSRNVFVENRVVGNDHGLWGGYSYGSIIAGNRFEKNRVGIAIEHGQDNSILSNVFSGDSTDIYLWANRIEPGDWGYPKYRDTRSRDYSITGNVMSGARVALRILQTATVDARLNMIAADTVLVARDTSAFLRDTAPPEGLAISRSIVEAYRVAPLPQARPVLPSAFANWPRSAIVVDEWGPYDWRSPKLWPLDSSRSTPLRLRVLGPRGSGRWRLVRAEGASVSRQAGSTGDTVLVTPTPGRVEDWTITLEYRGQATRSPRGEVRRAGEPYIFTYSRFDPKATWDVQVFAFSDSTHPLNATAAFQSLLRGERGAPALTQRAPRLDYMWYRPRIPGWPAEKYGVTATTSVDLPAGNYALRTISDDGIRVYVDDQLVIDDWSVHESRVRSVPLAGGSHRIRVEYFQGDGWAELRAEIVK